MGDQRVEERGQPGFVERLERPAALVVQIDAERAADGLDALAHALRAAFGEILRAVESAGNLGLATQLGDALRRGLA